MASSLVPGMTTPAGNTTMETGGDKKKSSSDSLTGAGVRRWAHRLLQRGQSTSSMPATPVGNGNLLTNASASPGDPLQLANSATGTSRSKTFASLTAGTAGQAGSSNAAGQAATAAAPPLPPKTPRSKPVPPPRTSSCLSAGNNTGRPPNTSAVHQDFIRYGNRPSSVSTALMMAQQAAAAAEALNYSSSSSTPAAVKSVRFGQQQQQQQTANQGPSGERTGEEKDALAEATIGLEIAANLALAFARDVRRERLAESGGSVQSTPRQVRMPSRPAAAPAVPAVRTTGHQEVTLSEFYQLLQFVGQARGVGLSSGGGGGGGGVIVSSDPPAVPSALNVGSTTVTSTTTTTTPCSSSSSFPAGKMAADPPPLGRSVTPLAAAAPPPAHLPPGYLTARSFRQSTTGNNMNNNNNNPNNQTTPLVKRPATSTTPLPAPDLDQDRQWTTTTAGPARRSHSVEVNYDNYLMSSQRPAGPSLSSSSPTSAVPSASCYSSSSPYPPPALAVSSSASNQTLKTRSLPRTQPTGTASVATTTGPHVVTSGSSARPTPIPTPVRHWAEILALITQVLSGADQYNNYNSTCPRQQQQQQQPAKVMEGKQRPRRPAGVGDSLSDSEEAYLRRQSAAAAAAATASPTLRDRHYDSLRTARPSSRASVSNSSGPAGDGHQSYLASLSQRLQIEQYIVKTLTHLTKSTTGTDNKESKDAVLDTSSSSGYIECWGSPERSRTPSLAQPNSSSNVGLERALLRLDQRRTDRQPRIYQHHHWRITPAECNALFLCKVYDGPVRLRCVAFRCDEFLLLRNC